MFSYPILIGDIGGTNARFEIIADKSCNDGQTLTVQTADFATIEDAVLHTLEQINSAVPKTALLAAAGPITDAGLDLTNCDWLIHPTRFRNGTGIETLALFNDFEAQALALPVLTSKDVAAIGTGTMETGHKAVLGPGTGLGVALLAQANGAWLPVAGEGGHIDLGPRSRGEEKLWTLLDAVDGRISAEQALSGKGIMNLYRAFCIRNGVEPTLADPAAVSTAALEGADRQAGNAMDLFCACLGRVAGDVALMGMTKGGVYIAGGIGMKILPFLQKSRFRVAFEDKAPHSHLLEGIATSVVIHPNPALAGLRALASRHVAYHLDLEGRHWSR